jgi:hypothetical protein
MHGFGLRLVLLGKAYEEVAYSHVYPELQSAGCIYAACISPGCILHCIHVAFACVSSIVPFFGPDVWVVDSWCCQWGRADRAVIAEVG